MAVTASNRFLNSIVGQMQVGSDVDIHETNSTPKFALGTGFTRQDGNKFRYVHAGADVDIARLVATDVSESCLTSKTNVVINPTSAVAIDNTNIDAGAVGSTYIQATITATANQFAGGYLHLDGNGGAGAGAIYRIKGNTATDDPASGDCRLELYEKIKVAVDQTTDIAITGSPYANVEGATSSTDEMAVGVSVVGISNNNYGWVCTHGVATVIADGNTNQFDQLTPAGRAGRVLPIINPTSAAFQLDLKPVGYATTAIAAGSYGGAMITIE